MTVLAVPAWLYDICRIVVGAVLLFTGAIKLFDLRGFVRVVLSYGLFPVALLPAVKLGARLTPFVEFFVGIALLQNWMPRIFGGISALLFTAFLLMLAAALIKHKKLENCGCLGTSIPIPLGWGEVWRDGLFLLLSLIVVLAA